MKRRIILILVVAGVVGLLMVGGVWYHRRQTGTKRLSRAEVAIRAGNYDRALGFAEGYVAKHPEDWRGHYYKGRALIHLARHADARAALTEAARLKPSEVPVTIALAESYSLPARRSLSRRDAAEDLDLLKTVIEQLRQSNKLLLKAEPSATKDVADVKESIGLNCHRMSLAWEAAGRRLAKEADRARIAREEKLAAEKESQSKAALDESAKQADLAIKALLEAVSKDASRALAARTLVELCIKRKDEKSLAAASKAIMALESPPPLAVMLLKQHELTRERDGASRRRQWEEFYGFLGKLLAKHPDQEEVKLARARSAVVLGHLPEAEKLCGEILKANPRHGEARLIQAGVLIRQGSAAEAEQVLFRLKTDMPRWVMAQFAYAQAALAAGREELAREAMRRVTELDPSHAGARQYMARYLLAQKSYRDAFTEAQAYHRAHPTDPAAIELFVQAAKHTGQPGVARKALEQTVRDHGSRPEVLLAVWRGYEVLGERARGRKALTRAAACKPTSVEQKVAVVRAMMMLKRVTEAERLLTDELARDADAPRVNFELGRLYAATGRVLEAIERFRRAVANEGWNTAYRLELAKALFRSGDMAECQSVLAEIDPSNAEANLLRLRTRLIQGEHVPTEETVEQARGTRQVGLPLALAYFTSGQLEQCVEVCLRELNKTPADVGLRRLLGQAYLSLGRRDECLKEWSQVLSASPEQLDTYIQIAGVLAAKLAPPELEKALAAIPNARAEMIDLTMGRVFTRTRNFAAAAEAYARAAARKGAPEFLRNLARLRRAEVLAAKGDVDSGVAELDKLATDEAWRGRATALKADVLIKAGRREEAAAAVSRLRKLAADRKDAAGLRLVAKLYVRMNQIDDALGVCDELAGLAPNEAWPLLFRATILSGTGRTDEALPLYHKAVELQPGNLEAHLTLAGALEARHQPAEALEVLRRMEKLGEVGQTRSLFQQGRMLAGWGLYAESLRCFQRLADQGHTGVPAIQLALGQAFAGLGQTDRAAELLRSVSAYSRQYAPARQLLAQIADTDAKRLAILGELEKARPDHAGAVEQKMRVLLGAGRAGEAVKAFHAFTARQPKDRPPPGRAALLAVHAMLAANDRPAAAMLAAEMSQASKAPRWRQLAILLSLDDKPDSAAGLLPPIDRSGPDDALLGLVMAVQKGDAGLAGKWAGRIDQIAQMPKPAGVQPRYRLLSALAAGRPSQAREELAKLKGPDTAERHAVAELVAWGGREKTKAAAEAAKLAKASLAIDLGLTQLGRTWAMEVLKARPECQWAAGLIMRSRPDEAAEKAGVAILRPKDCALARTIQGSLLMKDKKYPQAAEVYRKAAEAEEGNPYLVLSQALAVERAGRLAEAMKLYRQVWQATKSPVAANNAAYLVSQLHPKDAARLTEASKWMDGAVKARPNEPAFRDTKAWIAFLLGKKSEAQVEARRAVRGIPRSPEAHYHLGVIEGDAGNRDLSRWHLAAAVSSAEAMRVRGEDLSVAEANAVKLAKEALARMDRQKKG